MRLRFGLECAGRRWGFKRLCLVAGAALLALGISAPGAQSAPGQDSGVVRATLDNGLRVIIVRDTLAPVVTTVMNYQVGSNEAPEGFPGMAHAQEHMMFRGSPGLSADQLADIAAAMGGNFNADTQQTVTQYFFTVPAEDLDVALHLEAVRMRGVSRHRRALEGGARRHRAGSGGGPLQSSIRFLHAVAGGHVSGNALRPRRAGHAAIVRQDHGADAAQVLRHVVRSQQCHIRDCRRRAAGAGSGRGESLFGDIPRKTLPATPAGEAGNSEGEGSGAPTDLPYGLAVVSFRMPGSNSPDFAATQLLADALSSQRGTLYAMVPEGKALYAGFSLSTLPEASLGYALAVYPQGGDGDELVNGSRRSWPMT